MHSYALATLLFAVSALASPVLNSRIAPSTDLVIRGWNATTFDCNLENPHLWGEMGPPSEDTWGDGGMYDSYSLSRDLAANETLNLYSTSGGSYCGTLLYPISNLKAGCYQTSTSEMFSCMKMATS